MHDIEDLVAEGRRRKACPYFASTHLADEAELVFCPYKSALRSLIALPGRVAHRLTAKYGRHVHAGAICTARGRVFLCGYPAYVIKCHLLVDMSPPDGRASYLTVLS